ncbi:MAG: histidine--tRNA ligase [Candidatus Glassbacteria bacterium]
MKFKSPRGTHDILPQQVGIFRRVVDTSRRLFERSGYREVVTPMFEENELFARSVGSETDIVQKEMYVFKDRAGRELALRPEGTASVIRSYLQHGLHANMDVQKLYYVGPMFRYDRPSAGRYRQFHQVGIEAIGSLSPYLDVECIAILRDLAKLLGIEEVDVLINSVGCRKCRPGYVEVLKEFLADRYDSLCSDCKTRYRSNPLRVLDCKKDHDLRCRSTIPVPMDYLCEECRHHFDEVRQILDSSGIPYALEPYLVRGLDYYTKTAFELVFKSFGAQNSLGGGGRYDDLVEMLGGSSTPAVGFSAGVERIILALEMIADSESKREEDKQKGRVVDVFFVITDESIRIPAFREMLKVRNILSVDMDFTGKSVKAQFRKADKLGVRFAVIFGTDEMNMGAVKVKDMKSGEEVDVSLEDLCDHLGEMKVE